MATVINPDSGELIIKGSINASEGDVDFNKIRINSTDDIDLTNLPSDFASVDVALNVAGGGYFAGNMYIDGTFIANGDVITLGNTGGSLTLGANVNSNILPSQDVTYNIGSSLLQWDVVYTNKTVINSNPSTLTTTIDTSSSVFYVDSSTDANLSLPDGEVGQTMTIISVQTTSVEITPDNSLGFSSIVLTNAGHTVSIIYTNNGWAITSLYGASINT